jgi:hypothetical protein
MRRIFVIAVALAAVMASDAEAGIVRRILSRVRRPAVQRVRTVQRVEAAVVPAALVVPVAPAVSVPPIPQ